MAEISVIVPVYKVEAYLNKCVDSILSQTYEDFELILVDDGSPDGCGRICDEYAARDSRVHVIHQPNGGLSAARNAGLDWAEGHSQSNFVSFVDSDDWVERTYLATLMEGIVSQGVDVACVGYASVQQDYRYVRTKGGEWQSLSPEDYWSSGSFSSPVSAWAKLYRRHLFSDVRYPAGKINEDAFTTHKVLFKIKKVAIRDVPEYNYVERVGSIMQTKWNDRRLDGVAALEEELIYFRERGFSKAYSFTLGRLLVLMAEALPHLDCRDKVRADSFRRRIDDILAEERFPFWSNREFYRHMCPKTYWLRWAWGVMQDFAVQGRQSWICQELIPIAKLLLHKTMTRRCHAT